MRSCCCMRWVVRVREAEPRAGSLDHGVRPVPMCDRGRLCAVRVPVPVVQARGILASHDLHDAATSRAEWDRVDGPDGDRRTRDGHGRLVTGRPAGRLCGAAIAVEAVGLPGGDGVHRVGAGLGGRVRHDRQRRPAPRARASSLGPPCPVPVRRVRIGPASRRDPSTIWPDTAVSSGPSVRPIVTSCRTRRRIATTPISSTARIRVSTTRPRRRWWPA